jgi:glutamate-1-semialdehyde aminotransferase
VIFLPFNDVEALKKKCFFEDEGEEICAVIGEGVSKNCRIG